MHGCKDFALQCLSYRRRAQFLHRIRDEKYIHESGRTVDYLF